MSGGTRWLFVGLVLAASIAAQRGRVEAVRDASLSRPARDALARARGLSDSIVGKHGPARLHAIEVAATSYGRCAEMFEREPLAAALAAWSAAELWRRHGSLLLAEREYLRAVRHDAARYEQRGLLAAADMQRRQRRLEVAMKTYEAADRCDPRTTRAQLARLWVARILLAQGKVDRAICRFQVALESAASPRQVIDAGDHLAKAWVKKADFVRAAQVIRHVERVVRDHADGDPELAARLQRASQRMTARRALRRALDEQYERGADAARLDEHRRRTRKS